MQDGADRATTDFYGVAAFPISATIPAQQRPALAHDEWTVIAERARHESLRDLAIVYGVSHETIRATTRRASALAHETGGMATR
ncbi:MAG TPA: hypothetical protein VIL85_15435 [Thermomicrobiales bacterium]|jgi:hypothetical protein